MKIFFLTLFACFFLLSTDSIYAGNNTLIANYPAPSGSYNKIMLTNFQGAPTCSANTIGMLFMDPGSSTLEICTADGVSTGTFTPVPYPETCFNRFCSGTSCTTSTNLTVSACPAGFAQATYSGGVPMVDSFTPYTGYTVYSTACCTAGASALPTAGSPPTGNCVAPNNCGVYPACSAPSGSCDCFGNPIGSWCDCSYDVDAGCGCGVSCGSPTGNPTGL